MRIAIAGLGLIGGSIARAVVLRGHDVVAVDRPAVARRVLAEGVAVAAARTVTEAARIVDLVVLAAPPLANLRLLDELAGTDVVVTDVTSVKQPIVRRARRVAGFVGGHPMAGREKGGFAASREDLFSGKAWILTPTARTPRPALRRVERMVEACGAHVVCMTPAAHDRTVSVLSHLPQVVAWALAETAATDRTVDRRVAGSGWRDTTRLAASPRGLWSEILALNATEARRALAAFERALRRVRRDLDLA